ncbi:spermidine synthase [Arthrobacter sp. H14]|uniref:spermidine synthase n=1 Tax=Arthrobacter sp. H14 TaxID=1312959 RepID=UPI00047D5B18|nr:fused MFS/spermidine synthase [Arthrobacter sp. H14]
MDPSRLLRASGMHATIDEDAFTSGAYILSIGGAQQSHVNLAHPESVFYEYLRRIANVVDLVAPEAEPVRALHLGAGALTLARYIAVTRPGSIQHAVEHERELLDFVLRHLPLPAGTDLTNHIGDARETLAKFDGGAFDVVVLDVFAGPDSAPHLTEPAFYREAAALLSERGVLLVNVGDEPPLAFTRNQIRALDQVMNDVGALAEEAMFSGRYPGNVVLVGLNRPWPADWTERLLDAGPHPAGVRTGPDLDPLR